jgi:GT2 family glycosyltransferase
LARVVIPTYRASRTIREVVDAVYRSQKCAKQHAGSPIQVVVVDDGGNPNLSNKLSGTPVEIISTGGSGSAAVARNLGTEGFAGRFLVFVDADVVVDELCIEKLLEPLRDGLAEATVGNYSKEVAGMTFAARYKQLYIARVYERRSGYLHNEFWTAVGAIDAEVFRGLSGFDSAFKGACGEDSDLGVRLTKSGHRILAVPDAFGHHRNSLSLRQLLRNDWLKGLIAMRNYFSSDGSILDNRHATPRDILAVILAAALGFALPAYALSYPALLAGFATGVLFIAYLVCRADLLRTFATQGVWFALRACSLMFVLDVMRLTCVATGSGVRLLSRLTGAAHKRRYPSGPAATMQKMS